MKNTSSGHITPLFFSVLRDTLDKSCLRDNIKLHTGSAKSVNAIWLHTGQLLINGEMLTCGAGKIVTASDTVAKRDSSATTTLRFVISSEPIPSMSTASNTDMHCEIVFSKLIDTPSSDLLLRLDQVDFPPGAIAHKHTHPGPGIRYLVDGSLTLHSDHEKQLIKTGDAWFEDASSPVTATAVDTMPSRFVRAMLLPVEYEGRSTFTLHSETDAHKPRLQTNIRHDEKLISITNIQ